jgi:hypothetical protein
MQAPGRGGGKTPIGITFDSDFGNTIDGVLTLALLRAMSSKNESRVISVSITKANVKAAIAEEAITNFYNAGPVGGGTGFGGGPDKVGLATDGKMSGDTAILNAVVSKKTADGKIAYPAEITRVLDTAEGPVTMRNMLLAQNDENAVMVTLGPATDMAKLLDLYGAKPQLTAKVKFLVMASGSYPNGPVDDCIKEDIAAAKKVFADWPTPIIAVGSEVGQAIPYPGSSVAADFSWAPLHPVVDAYHAYKPMPYDATVPGMAAALYAVHPDDGYFKLSEPGTITILDDGRTKFTPSAGGKHRYLIADPAQKERVTKIYTEMVSSKPVARPSGRGRGGRGASGAAAAAVVAVPADKPVPVAPK